MKIAAAYLLGLIGASDFDSLEEIIKSAEKRQILAPLLVVFFVLCDRVLCDRVRTFEFASAGACRSPLAKEVECMAKSQRFSDNPILVEPIELGIEARPQQAKRLSDELVFGE